MKKGYEVFGYSYKIMYENDLHDKKSIDHDFLREMILLDSKSYSYLYNNVIECHDMKKHELFDFAQKFRSTSDLETIKNVMDYTSNIANSFNVDFEDMLFGGTEKQILDRGTDWCADMARVAFVLLECVDIPCRIVHLANIEKAYNGHVVIEAYYNNKYGVVDPINGYVFYKHQPLDAYELKTNRTLLEKCDLSYAGLFNGVAINNYNPNSEMNDYTVSGPNQYYLRLIHENHHDNWIMGENNRII